MDRHHINPSSTSTTRGATEPGRLKPAIQMEGIHKKFGTLEVLQDISLDVRRGEIVALVGSSGCGKSTLLNIIAGLTAPDSGTVMMDGMTQQAKAPSPLIAYMFQEDRLLPWRTALDNVGFGLEAQPHLVSTRQRRARAALELVGLADFERSYPHELSGGMRSRAALARSLVVEPRILLMDEPFSKLDPQTRTQMHDELLRIQSLRTMTIIFVTHDVEEAVVLADRVIVLQPRPGRINEIAPITLPRPRIPTNADVAEEIRLLRVKI